MRQETKQVADAGQAMLREVLYPLMRKYDVFDSPNELNNEMFESLWLEKYLSSPEKLFTLREHIAA
ncbi:hypothetical protein ACFFUO_03200 [Vibrio artabrorum]|uniref:Uncharacterized protein n=1 Tax=Vibrio artabrorum TaxID=446374 RepID=A0ABT8CLJ8_9VIBR|nr:hypothetical protein [Vibrio artabrorum]MDN3702617.1 hypothetical protein [Vibrio artabrorum]